MSFFYGVQLSIGGDSQNANVTESYLLKWHSKLSILAVTSHDDNTGGEVNIFSEKV